VERCIQPGAVTEDDLVAYAYGEADPAVARHVRTCPACAAAAAEYERLQHHLGGLLYRVECPPAETLAEFQLRLLPAIEQARVAAHVRACPRCAAEVATLGEDLAAAATRRRDAAGPGASRRPGRGAEHGRTIGLHLPRRGSDAHASS
jgi:anti-sigma factor RsiW